MFLLSEKWVKLFETRETVPSSCCLTQMSLSLLFHYKLFYTKLFDVVFIYSILFFFFNIKNKIISLEGDAVTLLFFLLYENKKRKKQQQQETHVCLLASYKVLDFHVRASSMCCR